ncbi:hypothetical protein [Sphingobacterium bovistauri]|uniref:Uncharacterized protein n=1 Tax=Sphingobacterium bovistauri TaxID=2781959 RepID=A0ABS7Z8Q4_9SPHI|nr:hypothetical protein [Sphingobacterium bovistauri]MCA5005245.1 hypothetical protein [Sphingobacterium bovistauri]
MVVFSEIILIKLDKKCTRMKIKIFITFLLFIFAGFSVKAQQNSELEKAIKKTITALNNQDFNTLNAMILKDFGVAVLFRRGAFDNLALVEKLNKNEPIPEYLPYDFFGKVKANQRVKYETLPEFDCDTEKFTKKEGIYCDMASKYKDISGTALSENEYLEAGWKPEHIEQMKEIEASSKRIVAYGKEGTHIFYLTWYKNNWYLTLLDRFEVCSA